MTAEPLTKRLVPGATLGHFEIAEVIGAGGMGIVFKARDLRLDRYVALKVLSRELFENETARARFFREAQLAASISHPNVATIHEVDMENGTPFIAMEWVPGTNVKELIRSGPIPLKKVISIGMQVCGALAAAHGCGVIHRDVKSSNIMITPEGTVKVLDFGLAKASAGSGRDLPQADSITKDRPVGDTPDAIAPELKSTARGVAVGTPSYMSPEQATGKPVDPRTDIFSLGVVLYEAVSGELPFKGESDHELLSAIRSKEPTPLHINGAASHSFSKVISTCLAKDPEKRYSSATLLQKSLRRLEKRQRVRDTLIHSFIGRVGLVATAVLLFATLLRWPPSEWLRSGATIPPGTSMVLADLDNQTGETQLDAVQTLLEIQLRQSPHARLLNKSALRGVLQKMVVPVGQRIDLELAREIAWRERSPLVVAGSLFTVGSSYILAVRLDRIGETPSPQATWSRDFRAPNKDHIYDAVDEASYWIRATLGEAAEQLETLNAPARDTTTSSWEALDLYVRAEQAQYAGRNDDARLLLKEAVALDPDFAMAWARLADISYSTEQNLVYTYHQRALDAMNRRRLTKYEELRIKAVYAHDSQDFPNATRLFRAFALTYPGDFVALSGYGYSLNDLGREEEALRMFLRAEPIRPESLPALANAARSYLLLGRFEDVWRTVQRMRDLELDDYAENLEGGLHFLTGNYEEAIDAFSRMSRSQNPAWEHLGVCQRAMVLVEIGRRREAVALLKESVADDIQRGEAHSAADKLLALAHIFLQRGERQACKDACAEAARRDQGAERLLRAGALLGRAGYFQEAQKIYDMLPELVDVPLFTRARHRILGEMLLSQGDISDGLEELKRAYELDAPVHENEYLAHALMVSGDLEEARTHYKKMSESAARLFMHDFLFKSPGLWSNAVFHYADISYSLGYLEDAQEAFRRYVALRKDPDSDDMSVARARELLREMGQRP